MDIFNLSLGKFKAINSKGINLDLVFILELLSKGVDIRGSFKSGRINSLLSTLERKGYIKDLEITDSGREFYNSLLVEEQEVVVKKVESKDKEWEEFLSYYPPNTRFIWRGREFLGDRGVKNNTKDGRELFTNILNNSSLSSEDLWRSVVAEAIAKMKESYKVGANKMQYFINTESWLRQKRYLNFLEEGRHLEKDEIEAYKEAYNRKKKGSSPNKTIDI